MDKKELEPIHNQQLNLNLDLFGLDPLLDRNYSNTLEIYDIAGKFLYDKQNKFLARATADETAFTRTTSYRGMELKLTVTAANIERTKTKDGSKGTRSFVFPGAREEIIEDVLRKLATEQRAKAYEATTGNAAGTKFVGISFSIYEVQEELRRVGKTYSYTEIREAIEIMHRSILTIQSEDDSIYLSAPFFPIVAMAEKSKSREDTKSLVCFHPMVTDAIHSLSFRRYNYVKALQFGGHYTRLLYKRLCHRWKQAAPDRAYTILLRTLITAMKAPYANLYQDKALVKEILDDLVEADVLSRYEMTAKREGKLIVDWKIELYATVSFAKQQAANNKVANAVSQSTGLLAAPDNRDVIDEI